MMQKKDDGCGCSILVLIIAAFVVMSCGFYYAVSVEEISGTIVKTQIEGGDTHYVFEHDSGREEVLENEDNWFFLKFNSSDYLADLEVGQHYRMKVTGERVPTFSFYRNILEYEITEVAE